MRSVVRKRHHPNRTRRHGTDLRRTTGGYLVVATCGADNRALVLAGFTHDGTERWRTDLRQPAWPAVPSYQDRFCEYAAQYAVTYREGPGIIFADDNRLTIIDATTGTRTARPQIVYPHDIRYPAVSVTPLGVIVSDARWDPDRNPSAPLWID